MQCGDELKSTDIYEHDKAQEASADDDHDHDELKNTDICEYNNTHEASEKCGDLCTGELCGCGDDQFSPEDAGKHCCIPSNYSCSESVYKITRIYTSEIQHWRPVCQGGRVLAMTSTCDNTDRRGQSSLEQLNNYKLKKCQNLSIFNFFLKLILNKIFSNKLIEDLFSFLVHLRF